MTALALARKWRPRDFSTLVGQEHVVKALTHALDQQRLHHAWLFTGTRGVGKTTISRILAKALNCTGADGQGQMTSQPCGKCPACTEIDAGRYVDYIEMDAASNRGVDDMAQLLEKAMYAPSSARFKVYMIDEVHMLTGHAFNAMLKTLEEPPPHVKFILATTDPQKIPVTVLSRCLQFNLKQMPVPSIVEHLEKILESEQVKSEIGALRILAKAAQGSMRDALSLTDQAIAYAAGPVSESAVRAMLGTLDETYLIQILDALRTGDGGALIAISDEMAARSSSFSLALQDLASLLQKIAVGQTVPSAVLDDWPEATEVRRLASQFNKEDIQLYYQIAITSRPDLSLAPDEQTGFTMALLRMLAFKPGDGSGSVKSSQTPRAGGTSISSAAKAAAAPKVAAATAPATPAPSAPQPTAPKSSPVTYNSEDPDWQSWMKALPVRGLLQQLAFQTELQKWNEQGDSVKATVIVGMPQLASKENVSRLQEALSNHIGKSVTILIETGKASHSIAAVEAKIKQEKQEGAEESIANDDFVKTIQAEFGATVVPGSIRPIQ
ncbi:DNA polymerase III subunit gamma/tau [Polynucleobacter cosmopolitanus]|uniref:DNA polymerase III subunit gamma/tau n=1 Tax=Polynucleobacter cosmopolitanus TaxID=351345 RepID=A0A229FRR3_9BURK|nr:DNA polymerase III subunit gamma/tau [Polynucleobacter cosmopolitanus]OXL14522.1 DNA polymerase III subunit gamma/tau [Polynucleobacter cosmopolitanus]